MDFWNSTPHEPRSTSDTPAGQTPQESGLGTQGQSHQGREGSDRTVKLVLGFDPETDRQTNRERDTGKL